MLSSDPRAAALAEIARYSLREAATTTGALCLVPENLHILGQLETLAHCCVALVPQGQRAANRTDVRNLVGRMQAWVGSADDPPEFCATQAFTFHGGTQVLIGPTPSSVYAMRLLGTLTMHEGAPARALRKHLQKLIYFFGQVSTRIAMRAGLRRNMAIPEARGVVVPPSASLGALQRAAVVPSAEWHELLESCRLDDEDLQVLVARPRSAAVDQQPYWSAALGIHPFLRVGTDTIAIAPHRIADAVTAHARSLIATSHEGAALADLFHGLACANVSESLRRLGLGEASPWRSASSRESGTLFSESLFQWDTNRLAHVVVVSDGCATPEAEWEPHDAMRWVTDGRAHAERAFENATPKVEEVFSLILFARMAGAQAVALGHHEKAPEHIIHLAADDLEALSLGLIDPDPPRFLGRFSRARHDLRARGCRVNAWSELDLIAAWISQSHRFPLGPDLLVVECDHGRGLREKAMLLHDRHAVPGPTRGTIVEVEVAEDESLPIYGRPRADSEVLQVVVEILERLLWFELRLSDGMSSHDRIWAIQCLRMCAYWTADIGRELTVRKPPVGGEVILIEVLATPAAERADTQTGYAIEAEAEAGRVCVSLRPSFTRRYDGSNSVERAFAADLLWSLLSAIGEGKRSDVDAALQRRAPVGPKRIMHSVDTSNVPEYHFSGELPRPVYAHEAELQQVSRWLGEQTSAKATAAGLEGQAANVWLNEAVGRIFAEIKACLARFDTSLLLGRLMLNVERLVFELAEEEIALASQIACHGAATDFVARLREAGPRRTGAATASRFLVELIASEGCGPGKGYPGDADVASLLAHALELVTLGAASDVVAYGLGQVVVRDDGGYLAVSRGSYDAATGAVHDAVLAEQLAREGGRLTIGRVAGSSRAEKAGRAADSRWARLSKGLSEEFGVSFEQFSTFLGDVLALWQREGTPVLCMAESTLVQEVARTSGLDIHQVASLVDSFTLRKRTDFLAPPLPFHPSDTYPWQHNRRLSYLQRPFVCDDKGDLRFSGGHAHRAWAYLLALMTTGRFKAKTQAMKDAMSTFTEAAGAEFNAAVATALRGRGFTARAQVKKFGPKKMLGSNGQDLGDIDVLAVDPGTWSLYVVECKNMSPDRMPHEAKSDLDALFLGKPRAASTQEKHLRRVAWVRANLKHVLDAWQLERREWSVQPLLVLSHPLHAPLLGHAKMKVLLMAELSSGASLC